ncbi:MAG: PmoA family protein [Isosphaeraceae bacterium]|nr:PmoA family protein [Isosphaeraceae bacterium]
MNTIACAVMFTVGISLVEVPTMQAIPLPRSEISLQRDGVEVARYLHDPSFRRPFVFPIVGPSGRSLTRMGHPHDPEGHSHHNSFWVSHHDVDGVSFWSDAGGRIVHQRVLKLEDGDAFAAVTVANSWVDPQGRELLRERRRIAVEPLEKGESLLVLDLELSAPGDRAATLGKTPFGLVGVRMAKTIGVNDGGGRIRNSEGGEGEQGPSGVFWKHARWVDYSGPIARGATEGITLLDHPGNPDHPAGFHVRSDGWMGASLTLDRPLKIEPGKPLRLRYGLYVHSGTPDRAALDRRWKAFAEARVLELPGK